MLVLIPPAKKLDPEMRPDRSLRHTRPALLKAAEELVDVARGLNQAQLADLMKISDKLAKLTQQRFRDFSTPFTRTNARQAILAFTGDTYQGLDASSMTVEDLDYAQDHLRILSGLYGLLRPLDLIQPYRLEMGARLKTASAADLYEFWQDKLEVHLNRAIARSGSRYLVNCASNEYFRVIRPEMLKAEIVTPVFKQVKDGELRMLGMMAKRARGAMARFIIEHRIDAPEAMKDFRADGYRFKPGPSDTRILEFHRNI